MIVKAAEELAFHIITIVVVLTLAAGVSHRVGSKTCGTHDSYSAHAAGKK